MQQHEQEYVLPVSAERFVREFDAARSKLCEVRWQAARAQSASWDGGHYSLRGHPRPVSVSKAEAWLLALSVDALVAQSVVEIGTGFGYSTSWLGLGAMMSGGRVLSIDDHSEGSLGSTGAEAAVELLTACRVRDSVSLVDGQSPDDIPGCAGEAPLDFVFIDGNHNGGHPERDFRATADQLADTGVILFHDAFWHSLDRRNTVHRAVERALADGFEMLAIDTSCQPVAVSRSRSSLELIRDAFQAAKSLTLAGSRSR